MTEPLRVLMVEDSEADSQLVAGALTEFLGPIEYQRIDDADHLRRALAPDRTWDVILLDWAVPGFGALPALAVLRELGVDTPVIVVSGQVGEERAVDALRAGARDFVLKDRLARLGPAVAREVGESRARQRLRQTEEALRESTARIRRLIDANIIGIVTSVTTGPRAGTLLEANDAFLAMTGYTRAALEAGELNWRTMTPPEFAALDDRAVEQVLATGQCAAFEKEYIRADGSRLPILMGAIAGNSPGEAYAFIIDNSERRRALDEARASEARYRRIAETRNEAEAALWLSEERFRRLSESGIIGIAFTDLHGAVHDANDTYLHMTGYTPEDLASGALRWPQLTDGTTAADETAVQQLASTGVAPPWEQEIVRKDGSRIQVLIGVAMLERPNCIVFIADLSERKRAEVALQRSQEQLRQAQKLEAIGILAGGVAHDFNNLLSIILSYSTLIAGALEPGNPLRADAEEILRAGERAADLTRQLLAFSRQQMLEPRIVDLNDVLGGMTKMLRRLIGEHIELAVIQGPDLSKVEVDPGQIEQVVMNLAVNARDAMPGGGKLSCETANVMLDEAFAAEHVGVVAGPHVMLAVGDTGHGMDAATQARIFEPFFTTKDKHKGTGLGLSTVLGIVQQSGGSIWVSSAPGRGTTFRIYFVPAVPQSPEKAAQFARPTTAEVRGIETVLLVEDDAQVRGLARTILRRQGYYVLDAMNGGEALLISEQHPGRIHLLLTDVVLPRMSGPQLAQRLATSRPDMRVLFMSGYTDDPALQSGDLDANIALLRKPLTPDNLARKVREVLDAP